MRRLTAYGLLACMVVGGLLITAPGVRAADPPVCDFNASFTDGNYPLQASTQPNHQNDNLDQTKLDLVLTYSKDCANPRQVPFDPKQDPKSDPAAFANGDPRVTMAVDLGKEGGDPPTQVAAPGSVVIAPGSSGTTTVDVMSDTAYVVTVKAYYVSAPQRVAYSHTLHNITVAAPACHSTPATVAGVPVTPGIVPDSPVNCAINGFLQFILDQLLWLQDRKGPQALNGHSILDQVLTTGAAGDLTGLCRSLRPTGSSPADCSGDAFAAALAPYAGILAMVLWGLSVLRSVYVSDGSPDPGATLGYLTHQMRTGLLTLAGVWLAYPASRFLWEMCSAGSNAMVSDITGLNGGNGTLTSPLDTTTSFLAFPVWLQLAYMLVIVLEVLFVSIWMLGSTVAVLIGSIFGSFAVATGPISGLGGMLGRWMNWMTRFLLLRLFLPPITAVLIGIMRVFLDTHGAGVHVALLGVSTVVFVMAIVWVTGQVMGFLMEGIAGAGRTIPGMARIRFR